MKCEFVKVSMQSVQIEEVGDCRTQKRDAQLKASTEDDRIKLFPAFVAESNVLGLGFADPGLNGNPALTNPRKQMLAHCPPDQYEITAGADRANLPGLANHPTDVRLRVC